MAVPVQSWRETLKLRYIYWGFLLLDVSWQILHFGGMTLLDQTVHAMFLALATLVLVFQGRIRRIPAFVWVPVLVVFFTAFFQVVPLTEGVVKLLSPGKFMVEEKITLFFPEVVHSSHIAYMPWFLKVRLSSWFLDAWFFALVLMGPHLSRKIFYLWTGSLSLLLGSVLLMEASGKWQGTFQKLISGPGNENQTAGFLVFLMAIGFGLIVAELTRLFRSNRQSPYKRFPILAAAAVGIGINLLALFPQGSRSGFLLGIVLLFSLPSWWFLDSGRRWLAFGGSAIVCVIGFIAILSMDSERLTQKLQKSGFYDEVRHEANRIGLDELWPLATLGQGLGSSPSLLAYRFPNGPYQNIEMTEFHNDWLQLIVEMGMAGIVFIFFVGYWLFLILQNASICKSVTDRYFSLSVCVVVVLVGLHSLVTFPLRIIGIRVFLLLVLGKGLRTVMNDRESRKSRILPAAFILVGLGTFWLFNADRFEYLADPNPKVARAARYGTVYNIPIFQAHEAVLALMQPMPVTEGSTLWRDARTLAVRALKTNPTSLRSMNLIFQLDLVKAGGNIERDTFAKFKEQANFIQNFGHPQNQNAPLAKMLLYQSYPGFLSEDEKVELHDLEKSYRKRISRANQKLFGKN